MKTGRRTRDEHGDGSGAVAAAFDDDALVGKLRDYPLMQIPLYLLMDASQKSVTLFREPEAGRYRMREDAAFGGPCRSPRPSVSPSTPRSCCRVEDRYRRPVRLDGSVRTRSALLGTSSQRGRRRGPSPPIGCSPGRSGAAERGIEVLVPGA